MPSNDRPLRLRLVNAIRRSGVLSAIKKSLPKQLKSALLRLFGINYAGPQKFYAVALPNSDGATVLLPNDPYWSYYIDKIELYEPEIAAIIDRFLGPKTLFLDCGANVGLWSSYAAHKAKDARRVIAVEPTDELVDVLKRNQELSGNGFQILKSALWSSDDVDMTFNIYSSHAANSLMNNIDARGEQRPVLRVAKVKTVSIDGIISSASKSMGENPADVLVKLDVEGVEIQALQGAVKALAGKSLRIIFEEHGKDRTSEVTQYILEYLGMNIYNVDPKLGTYEKIRCAEDLQPIKLDPAVGYNFLACFDEL